MPVAIDYPAVLVDDLPKYQLVTEISPLLHIIPGQRRKMLSLHCRTSARGEDRSPRPTPCGRHSAYRLVPLSDAQFVTHLEMNVATLRIPLERKSEKTGRTEMARLREITGRTSLTWITEAVEAAASDGVTLSVPVTQNTFRHKSAKLKEIYTRVFTLDVAARHSVQFQITGSEAVNLLKSIRNDST